MATKEECAVLKFPNKGLGFTIIKKTALDDEYLKENKLHYIGVNEYGMDEYHHVDYVPTTDKTDTN
jgi:hypothetical protein